MQRYSTGAHTASDTVSDLVIGMSDGMIIPFILAAGLTGAGLTGSTFFLLCGGAILLGAAAMSLSAYFAAVSETKTGERLHREKKTLGDLGFTQETEELIRREIDKDHEMMLQYGSEIYTAHPKRTAITVGTAYILGGVIPLLPFFVAQPRGKELQWSAIITILCLFVFGYFKARYIRQNPLVSALRMVLLGAIGAAAAFFIAGLLR